MNRNMQNDVILQFEALLKYKLSHFPKVSPKLNISNKNATFHSSFKIDTFFFNEISGKRKNVSKVINSINN